MQAFSPFRPSTSNHTGHVDISTSYVDQLQSYSSPPSSIAQTPRDESPLDLERALPPPKFTSAEHSSPEETPLIRTTHSHHTPSDPRLGPDCSYGAVHHHIHTHDLVNSDASEYFEGHHRHESRSVHSSHHERTRPTTMYGPEEIVQSRPSNVGHVHHMEPGHSHHRGLEAAECVTDAHAHQHFHQHHHGHEDKIKVGNKRQIVGILVRLDLGPIYMFTTHAGQGITIGHHDSFIGYRADPVNNVRPGL